MTDKPTVQQPQSQPAPRPETRPIHTGLRRPDPRLTTR